MLKLKIVEKLKNEKDLDCLVILNKYNILYLTGFLPDTFSCLIIGDETKLFVSKMDYKRIENLPINVLVYERISEIFDEIKKFKKIGIEKSEIRLDIYEKYLKDVELVNFDEVFKMRRSKDGNELKRIENAIKICKEVFEKIYDKLKPGVSEIEIKLEIERNIKEISDISFEPIVAFDENTSIPHHKSTRKKLKEIALLDFGARYEYYCCDISRTIILRNKRKYEDFLEIVKDIKEKASKKIKEGVPVKEIDLYIRSEFGELEKYFIHASGHGIGLEIHEQPRIYKDSNDRFVSKDVITIEPGLYFKDFGIRIEDDYYINVSAKNLSDVI